MFKDPERYGFRKPKLCNCGSGEYSRVLNDARGIYCGHVCDKCEDRVKAKYRPDIFEDSDYWHDEPIEEEY